MNPVLIPAEQKSSVRINGMPVGALHSYRENTVHTFWQPGESGPEEPCQDRLEHKASVSFFLMNLGGQECPPLDLSGLRNFTLEIRYGSRKVTLNGCEFTAFETGYAVGKPALCTMELQAVSRSCVIDHGA